MGKKKVYLKPGELINNEYKVLTKLGEGGFGSVYKVENVKTKLHLALKIELRGSTLNQVMKMEVAVLKRLQLKSKHVVVFQGCGQTENLNYLLMGLAGSNLHHLRQRCTNQKFSLSTGVRLAVQCFQAIKDVHGIGFVHRDIKPSNFTTVTGYETGTTDQGNVTVYIVDFGLCRPFRNSRNQLRTPRKSTGFRGTSEYCSLRAHQGEEIGRQDDLISWLYMFIEFIRGKLPWREETSDSEVEKIKKTICHDKLFEGCPEEFHRIMHHLEALDYSTEPQYDMVEHCLITVMKRKRYSMKDPFDWTLEQNRRQKRKRCYKTTTKDATICSESNSGSNNRNTEFGNDRSGWTHYG